MPTCHKCFKNLEVWMDWCGEQCPEDPPNGHVLSLTEIKGLPGWDTKQSTLVKVNSEGLLHTIQERRRHE